MTLDEMRKYLQDNPHSHCDNEQCLKLLEIIAVLRAGLSYVDGFATGYLTKVRGLAERADELERSL